MAPHDPTLHGTTVKALGAGLYPELPDSDCITNRVFDELEPGESASVTRTVTQEDIQLFALVSGDVNPAHLDAAYAETGRQSAMRASEERRSSFLKKRSKKLLFAVADLPAKCILRHESFLVLFFKKEHRSVLSSQRVRAAEAPHRVAGCGAFAR